MLDGSSEETLRAADRGLLNLSGSDMRRKGRNSNTATAA